MEEDLVEISSEKLNHINDEDVKKNMSFNHSLLESEYLVQSEYALATVTKNPSNFAISMAFHSQVDDIKPYELLTFSGEKYEILGNLGKVIMWNNYLDHM
jgi:hypothetical protein